MFTTTPWRFAECWAIRGSRSFECPDTLSRLRPALMRLAPKPSPDHVGAHARSVMTRHRPDFTSEDTIADDRVEQHERIDKETLAPEHERERGMGRRRRIDRNGKGNHVGPE